MQQHTDIIAAFLAELSACDIRPSDPSQIRNDGAWHRLHVEGDARSAKNLAYKIHNDARPSGFFQDHKRGVSGTFSAHRNPTEVTPDQRAAWADAHAKRLADQAADYAAAAKTANAYVAAAKGDPSKHPYVIRKGITPSKLICARGELLIVPVIQTITDGKGGPIVSYQSIDADGGKLFMPGGRMADSFHPIAGADKKRALICEGYATGAALAAASGHSVFCAMSASNIAGVAATIAAAYPDRELVICADNDHHTAKKTGKEK